MIRTGVTVGIAALALATFGRANDAPAQSRHERSTIGGGAALNSGGGTRLNAGMGANVCTGAAVAGQTGYASTQTYGRTGTRWSGGEWRQHRRYGGWCPGFGVGGFADCGYGDGYDGG